MAVVEALLSSLFEVVMDKLVATPLLDYARRLKVDVAVLKEWRETLKDLQAVLHDAERRQTRDEFVKRWLDDLQDLAYDIEDVLDEFDAEAHEEPPQTSTSKVRKLIHSFNPSRGATFNEKIKQISQKLNAIVKRKSDLHLTVEESRVAGGVSSLTDNQRLTTSLLVNRVYGRDGDLDEILELLLSDPVATADEIQVISIVGMGGVGKTTLAQKIYNDERVENHFALLIWVCVSDPFDLVEITKAILDDSSNNSATLQSLQQRLQAKLKGKRFFLVLDDIWNEDTESWRKLKASFRSGAPGSVILVTTRHDSVADKMRTTPNSHHLNKLSDDDCWSVFEHLAFDNLSSDTRQNLEPIGKKIVEKCDGLPLAATTLAGLLRGQNDEKFWENMLNNEIWNLPTGKSKIRPALHLSYHHLPKDLKQCFAYCSIFPKDHRFQKDELIMLWAAQGLLGNLKRGETVEDVGQKYFQDLLSRSLFQQYPQDLSLFVMHDLIHDLAQFVSGEFCLRLEVEKINPVSRLTRHVSFFQDNYENSKKFDPLNGVDKLRTFLPLNRYRCCSYLADKVLYDLLPKFKCLRFLSLAYYSITCLPDSFGNLKQLQYLNLSNSKIQKLPKSIGKLVNLKWLMLSNCDRLTQLPREIGKLIHLHHLDISNTKLEYMPIEINRLKDLRILTTFVVGKHCGVKIMGLQDLSHLHLKGALSFLNLQNVVNAKEASEANLKEKEGLDELRFVWDPNASDIDSINQTRVLENLKPHDKMRRLSIQSYQGTDCPKWLGNLSFNSLVSLRLTDCIHWRSLPSLGQLQCLEFLRFQNMMEWEEWGCGGVEFPSLKELHIEKCPKLKGDMPERLPLLTRLEISGCGDKMLTSSGSLISLTSLTIGNVCKIPVELGQLQSLENLCVENCPELEEIPPIIHNLSTLKYLGIRDCKRLSSFPEAGLPPKLETLEIMFCPNLESLPEGMLRNNTAQLRLSIFGCDSLRSLPIDIDLLGSLSIWNCKKVELALPEEMMRSSSASLTDLKIVDACDSLTSFPLAFFPNLATLRLQNCENLECLHIPDGIQHRGLTSLNDSQIGHCPNMVSSPQGGLLACNLRHLSISNCRKLESLPQRMHTLLTSLQSLLIWDCPEIASFPEGGLPPSLSSLEISNCDKLMACRNQWRLRTLTSLTELQIKGGLTEERMESFTEEEPFLPSTLTSLEIGDFPNLKSLDEMGVEHLTSLQTLRISHCRKLESFPKLGPSLQTLEIWHCGELESVPTLGPSLQTLKIYNCKKLKSFTKQGLPASVSRLVINKCPVLEKRCQRDKGKLWPTISHIPCIIFGWPYEDSREVILS